MESVQKVDLLLKIEIQRSTDASRCLMGVAASILRQFCRAVERARNYEWQAIWKKRYETNEQRMLASLAYTNLPDADAFWNPHSLKPPRLRQDSRTPVIRVAYDHPTFYSVPISATGSKSLMGGYNMQMELCFCVV